MIHHATIRRWLQPGGHVDGGDRSPLDAASREVEEETGIATDPVSHGLFDVDVHGYPGRPGGDPPHLHFDLRFLFTARTAAVVADAEVLAAGWFTTDEMVGGGADRSVLRPIAKVGAALSWPPRPEVIE